MDNEQSTERHGAGIVGPKQQTGIARYRKAIAAGAAGAGLSLLLATGVFAAPPATPGTGTPTTSPAPSSQPANGTPAAPAPGDMPAPGSGGRGQGRQAGAADPMRESRGGGTVTAVSGNTITVAAGGPNINGATTTITVDANTVYMLGGPDKATTAAWPM